MSSSPHPSPSDIERYQTRLAAHVDSLFALPGLCHGYSRLSRFELIDLLPTPPSYQNRSVLTQTLSEDRATKGGSYRRSHVTITLIRFSLFNYPWNDNTQSPLRKVLYSHAHASHRKRPVDTSSTLTVMGQ
ncbi:hypothetical protein EYR40_002827 [Pleurotus pulmonarius]|nr:hypothetical protein EYR40_002827 [Pleurotus pulmonarius]KAF4582322.1 hypothetical protein EYR38_002440 [Pleurotus pulmonarius]